MFPAPAIFTFVMACLLHQNINKRFADGLSLGLRFGPNCLRLNKTSAQHHSFDIQSPMPWYEWNTTRTHFFGAVRYPTKCNTGFCRWPCEQCGRHGESTPPESAITTRSLPNSFFKDSTVVSKWIDPDVQFVYIHKWNHKIAEQIFAFERVRYFWVKLNAVNCFVPFCESRNAHRGRARYNFKLCRNAGNGIGMAHPYSAESMEISFNSSWWWSTVVVSLAQPYSRILKPPPLLGR